MNTIERKELKGELKYKDTVILTYQIQYPEITSSPYESGRKVFNQYNRQRALLLENRVKTQLYQDAKDLYDYNTANGYPVMVYEIVSQFTLTYQQGSIILFLLWPFVKNKRSRAGQSPHMGSPHCCQGLYIWRCPKRRGCLSSRPENPAAVRTPVE